MDIQTLREGQRYLNETKCAIYNTLKKFRPDLRDEMERVGGREINQSLYFLKSNDLWDETAQKYLDSFMHWMSVYQQGPDEWAAEKRQKAQDRLMCYVAKLIRDSAGRG